MLSKESLQSALVTSLFGKRLFFFESLDSTNTCARTLAEAGMDEGAVVVTEFQTSGRGRHGRTWTADAKENLLFSVLLRPPLPKTSAGFLTFFAAVSVARALEEVSGQPMECKWPNDLLLNGRKVCGILLENSFNQELVEYSVIGIGINVNQTAFPGQLAPYATSLALELSTSVDRVELFSKIMASMESAYREARDGNFQNLLSQWNARCKMFGRTVTVVQDNRRITGRAIGLNHDGGLLVETETGTIPVYAGDIALHQNG